MNTSAKTNLTGIAAWTNAAGSALMRAHVAEFVGAFVLVFAGCGAVVIGRLGPVGVALTFGLAIGLMVYSFGHISGGHSTLRSRSAWRWAGTCHGCAWRPMPSPSAPGRSPGHWPYGRRSETDL